MLKGIIFDCDGTLVDSRARMVPFYNRLFARCGVPLLDETDPQTVAACVSLADADIFARFISDPERRAAVAASAGALSDDELTAELTLTPHALETLEALRPTLRLAVATNRVGDMAAVTRRFSFDRHVDVIVTAADVECPKPAPDMLLLAARRLHLRPHELLFVGDTDVDRQAAVAAGMAFVLYSPVGCPEGKEADGLLAHHDHEGSGPPEDAPRRPTESGDPAAPATTCLATLADLVTLLLDPTAERPPDRVPAHRDPAHRDPEDRGPAHRYPEDRVAGSPALDAPSAIEEDHPCS